MSGFIIGAVCGFLAVAVTTLIAMRLFSDVDLSDFSDSPPPNESWLVTLHCSFDDFVAFVEPTRQDAVRRAMSLSMGEAEVLANQIARLHGLRANMEVSHVTVGQPGVCERETILDFDAVTK